MNTYSPISGMIICQNDTGDYVAKPDYDALIQTLAQERQRREKAEAKLAHFVRPDTLPHSIDDATTREWDLARDLDIARRELAEALSGIKQMVELLAMHGWKKDESLQLFLHRTFTELAEARKDTERMDWLDQIAIPFKWISPERIDSLPDITLSWRSNDSLRKAIDAARKAGKGQP